MDGTNKAHIDTIKEQKGGTKVKSGVHGEAPVLSWQVMGEEDASCVLAPRSPRNSRGRAKRPGTSGAKRTVTKEAET